jgi:hypothetical protein
MTVVYNLILVHGGLYSLGLTTLTSYYVFQDVVGFDSLLLPASPTRTGTKQYRYRRYFARCCDLSDKSIWLVRMTMALRLMLSGCVFVSLITFLAHGSSCVLSYA